MPKSVNYNYIFHILFIIAFIILSLVFVIYYKKDRNIFEDFISYGPYPIENNNSSPEFKRTLQQWEQPFNSHNEGYLNAEPCGVPPLVPIIDFSLRS